MSDLAHPHQSESGCFRKCSVTAQVFKKLVMNALWAWGDGSAATVQEGDLCSPGWHQLIWLLSP